MSQRPSELQIEAALTAFSVGYRPGNLVADQILPVVQHTNETGVYWKWSKDLAFDVPDTLIADGSEAKTVDVKAEKIAFTTEEYGANGKITDRQRKNAANILQLEQNKVRRAQDAVLMDQERRVYRMIRNTCPGASLTGTDKFSDPDCKSIEELIDNAKTAVRKATGGTAPNTIVIPVDVARYIKRNPAIRDLVKFTAPDLLINGDLPPTLFGLRVLMPGAVQNVGTTTVDLQDIWGDDVLVCYTTTAPELESPSLGYIIREGDWMTYTYRKDEFRTTFYRPTVQQTEILAMSDAGYMLKDVL